MTSTVGLIRWNPESPDDPGIALGGIVYGCPITSVIDAKPDLAQCAIGQVDGLTSGRRVPSVDREDEFRAMAKGDVKADAQITLRFTNDLWPDPVSIQKAMRVVSSGYKEADFLVS